MSGIPWPYDKISNHYYRFMARPAMPDFPICLQEFGYDQAGFSGDRAS
jgi:hypothetical protein